MKGQLKYFIWVLGCQMNESDAERVAAVLEYLGYQKTKSEDAADLIVVMACSVRQKAIDRILGKYRKWNLIKKKRKLVTVLSGCILPDDKPKMGKIFDVIFEMKDLAKLPKLLKQKAESRFADYLKIVPLYNSSFQAFVPISTGCNNFCTYCAVPLTKGREKSRPEKEILKEAEALVKKGYKEITLLGQNVNSYGNDLIKKGENYKNYNFPNLLKKINAIPGKFWIRFLTSNPYDMSDELIKAVKNLEKVCEYIHLPVQAGNDEVLKRMNRRYTAKHYLSLIGKIKKEIPGVAITTDTIVGFPGETKSQFSDTLDLYNKVGYDMAFIAQYSPRPGTVAYRMKDDVLKEEKKRREEALTKILRKTALKNNKKYIGKEVEVLVYKKRKEFFLGRTRTFKLVQFTPLEISRSKRLSPSRRKRESGFLMGLRGAKDLIGEFIKVKITSVTPWAMKGKLIK